MVRRSPALGGCVFAVILVLAIACGTPDRDLPEPDASPPVAPEGVCGYVEAGSAEAMGSEAVHPSLTPEPGKPTFTEDDVRAYITRTQGDETPPLEVRRVEFMTACEVAVTVNHPVYKPDDTLLTLVTIAGVYGGTPLPPGVTVTGIPDPNVVTYLILDATSGNVIGRTFGSEPP